MIDLAIAGVAPADLEVTEGATRALASTVSRAFNNLLTMVLAFIALAIPITANMYTPRLIEIFVRDRVNLVVLLFYVLMGANAVFVQSVGFDRWAPTVMYVGLWTSAVVGFAILVPYYFYVLSFLDPERIIDRVTERVIAEYRALGDGDPVDVQGRLADRIHRLGNVILRAIDRADRDVAIASIDALRCAVVAYAPFKREAPKGWFDVNPELCVGLSEEAIELAVRERNWVERRCLMQLLLAYEAALSKMTDAISAISEVNRRIAVHAIDEDDRGLVRLCVRFFNSFLRSAIRCRDVHAIQDVLHQYRRFGEHVSVSHPDVVLELMRRLRYYGELARFQGLRFVCELAGYEVGQLVEHAFDAGSPARHGLLEGFLTFDLDGSSARLVTARAVLAGYFALDAGCGSERQAVVASLAGVPRDLVQRSREAIASTVDGAFWEVTDSQVNLDWVPLARRESVLQVLDEVLARPDAD